LIKSGSSVIKSIPFDIEEKIFDTEPKVPSTVFFKRLVVPLKTPFPASKGPWTIPYMGF
jgi:hypothetical protein